MMKRCHLLLFLVIVLSTHENSTCLLTAIPFHIQMSFINVIYKRFKSFGVSDALVPDGIVANGSVDHVLCINHFNHMVMHCHQLFYDAFAKYL